MPQSSLTHRSQRLTKHGQSKSGMRWVPDPVHRAADVVAARAPERHNGNHGS